MSHIFISYSSQNRPYAKKLASFLINKGFKVWIDTSSLQYGINWWNAIVDGIVNCSAFFIIMTPDSYESEWVQRELFIALHEKKPIFPLLLKGKLWEIFYNHHAFTVENDAVPDDPFLADLSTIITPDKGEDISDLPVTADTTAIDTDDIYDQFEIAKQDQQWSLVFNLAGRLKASGVTNAEIEDAERLARMVIERDQFIQWVAIPAGRVRLSEYEWHSLPPFRISKYPVNVAEYQKFMEDQGYYRKELWKTAGWNWKVQHQIYQPARWNPTQMNHPVVGISWYEAEAYCRWLSRYLDDEIALPTELQWQYSAQGDPQIFTKYPWGNKWDVSRCNNSVPPCNSQGIMPVNAYESTGQSAFGVVDLAGNIWEWTASDFDSQPNIKVLRGGSWLDQDERSFQIDYRCGDTVTSREYNYGFRCARIGG